MNLAKPKRRWYQFSLRTMFVGVTLVSIPLAWVGYQLNWIRQRHRAFDVEIVASGRYYTGTTKAPGGLWLFGEEGDVAIFCVEENAELARRLFPEAKVFVSGSGPTILPPQE